jgi:hypothetical protein
MSSPWYSPTVTLPTDGQQCWIRLYYFGPPSIQFYRSRDNTFAQIYADATGIGYGGDSTNDTFYGSVSLDQNTFMKGSNTNWYFGWFDTDNAWEINTGPQTNYNQQLYSTGPPLTSPIQVPNTQGGPGGVTMTFARAIPAFLVGRWRPY